MLRLPLRNYMLRGFPSPPDAVDYTTNALNAGLRDVLGNDENGDCTIAAAYHAMQLFLANAGQSDPNLNAQDCLNLYYHLTGGDDTGLDEQTVLTHWQTCGLTPDGSHKLAGFVGINPTDEVQVKTALWLFENVYFGVGLPDAWVNNLPSSDGFTWGLAGPADHEHGHAFIGCGYQNGGVKIDTWGLFGTMPFGAVAYYCSINQGGQLFTVLSPEVIDRASARCPAGFDWTQLQADFQALSSV